MKKKYLLIGLTLATTLSLAACSKANETGNKQSSNSKTEQASKQKDEKSKLTGLKVSLEEAVDKYQETYPDTDITSVELDSKLGDVYYKVKGRDDDREYEISVNAETQEIKKGRDEKIDAEEQGKEQREAESLDLAKVMNPEEAIKIAEKEVGTGHAAEAELDKELSITFWNIKIKDGLKEINVKVNAVSGEVLETKKD